MEEAITRLSRVGFDHVLGYLEGGIAEWKKAGMEVDAITSVGAEEFSRLRKNSDIKVIDVRKPGEYLSEHIVEAESIPLVALNGHLAEIPAEGDFYLHCLSGYRSLIAMSILKARGFHNGTNVLGGFNAIKETDTPLSDYVCPSTL